MIYFQVMGKFELTVILDGKVTPAKIKAFSDRFAGVVNLFKGKVVKSEEWGKRDLYGKIKKSETGFYLFLELELEPESAKKLNDKLRTDEDIIRYLLIKIEK
jgi:small subunit ribosomal protein S6